MNAALDPAIRGANLGACEMATVAVSSTRPDSQQLDMGHNLRAVRTYIRENGLVPKLKALEEPAPWMFSGLILIDWAVILAAMAAPLYLTPWLLPISVIVIASRQRALGIFVHDASHKHICRNTRLNDWIGRYLLALPLFEDFASYRKSHLDHYRNLGHDSSDPDYVDPRWFAHIDPNDTG